MSKSNTPNIAPSVQGDDERPKINVVDRRSSILESENGDIPTDGSVVEERLPTYVEKLKHEAEEKDRQLREYIAAYKQSTVQNDEFRQRLQRENEARLDQFKANLFARLVPILDNLKRAAGAANQNSDYESLKKGIDLVINQFSREMTDNGVTPIPTQGRKFDPKSDEVCFTVETDDPEQNEMILEEMEAGYMFKEKLIKPARVKIAKLKNG